MTDPDLVGALQAAISRADPSWMNQPSHLRRRLEEELGPDARQLRAQTHQLVVAVEERIPIRLKRHGWSPTERIELAHVLVATRGWTPEASDWAVVTWAAALGLTGDRSPPPSEPSVDAAASPASHPPTRESDSRYQAVPTEVPSAVFAPPTALPSHVASVRTEVPNGRIDVSPGATELPAQRSSDGPAAPQKPLPHKAPARAALITRGTKKWTKKAAAYLGHDLDVAYLVKAGPSPLLLLLALPIGLAAFAVPSLSGFLLLAFMLIMIVGNAFWPSRVLAVKGDDVWLIANRNNFGVSPKRVIAQGTRNEIEMAHGWPIRSVRFKGQRLWFGYPITRAPRRLVGTPSPTPEGGLGR